jgi:hypothetical protein
MTKLPAQVTIKSPDIAAGIAYVRDLGDFGPEKLHVCVESEDGVGRRNTVALTGVKTPKFAEVFGDCDDITTMLRACLTEDAKESCDSAWGCVHLGHGAYESFNAFEGLDIVDDWTNDMFWESLRDD